MPEITLGQLNPSSIASGSGALKAYLDNGNQVGSLPVSPIILIDLVGLSSSEITYTFDCDLLIKQVMLGSAVSTTVKVVRLDSTQILSLATSTSIVTEIIVARGEQLVLSAASSVNARLVCAKSYVEIKV